jgi:hypothetical protein
VTFFSGAALPPGYPGLGIAAPSLASLLPGFGPAPTAFAPGLPAEALRQQAAALLQRCYHWLETAVPAAPQAAGLVPALVTAVAQYEAQQYEACLAQTAMVIGAARHLQMSVPTLAPL